MRKGNGVHVQEVWWTGVRVLIAVAGRGLLRKLVGEGKLEVINWLETKNLMETELNMMIASE